MRWTLPVMAVIFGVISGCLVKYIYDSGFSPDIGSGPYILLSGSLSMFLVSIGWFVSLYISRRQNTLGLIAQSMHSERYQDSVSLIDKSFPDGSTITPEELKKAENHEIKKAAVYVLNYLEFICIGIRQNDLSETVCKKYYKSGFKHFYQKNKSIIELSQNNYSPLVWEHFIHYTKKWNKHLK